MKKLFRILTAAVVAIAAVACQQNVLPESTPALVKHIKAYADNSAETKTALNGRVVEWEVDDVITVFDEDGDPRSSNELTEQDINSTVAEFTVNGLAEDAGVFAAIYPADDHAVLDLDGNVSTLFPRSQVAKNGSFGQNTNLAIASTEDDLSSLRFKNVGGLLALKVGGANIADVTSIEISANEVMAGSVTVDIDTAEATRTSSDNADKTVTLEGSFENNGIYYFSVLPGTYTGLKIVFKRPGFTATYSNPNSLTVTRNSNTKIGEITIRDDRWVISTDRFDATMAVGTNASEAKVNEKDAIKVGTGSESGNMTITVGAGATSLSFYAAAWNNAGNTSLTISPAEKVLSSQVAIGDDSGVSGNSPFALSGNESDYKVTVPLQNITEETTITLSANIRFVVWGATYTIGELPKYSITVADGIEGGTVTSNFMEAEEGIEIILTATPADDYEFGSWNVTNASTNAPITVTDNKFRMPGSDVNVSASFVKNGSEVTYMFADMTDFSKWGSSYEKRTMTFDDGAYVELASANKSTTNITDCPVSKGGDVIFKAPEGSTINSLTFTCKQWSTKSQTITLHTSTDGETYTATNVTSSNFVLSAANLNEVIAVKFTFSSPANQIGYESIKVVYGAAAALTSVTVSGDVTKKTYLAGDKFETAGLVAMAQYDDNTTKNVTDKVEWSVTPETLTAGTTSVSVVATYKEVSSTTYIVSGLTVTAPATLTSISVKTLPTKVDYKHGEKFDPTGLVISRNYSDGRSEDYAYAGHVSDFSFAPSLETVLTKDDNKVTITYQGKSVDLPIAVTLPTFTSLNDLVAEDLTSGTIVKVSFENVPIKSIYVSPQNYRNGIYFNIQKGDKDIEIFYQNVPGTWVAGGTVSGTMTCPWKNFNGTWELVPEKDSWSWNNLTYTAPLEPCEDPIITISDAGSATITCATAGASIYYTLGTSPADPTDASTLYSEAVTMTDGQTIKAIAYKDGMKPSSVASKSYSTSGKYTYSFTIQTSDFNTTSYAANNGSHDFTATCTTDASKTMTVACTSNQVMQNSSVMQWQKNSGYIYNTTDLGAIKSVTVNSSAESFTTYYGTSEHPTSGAIVGNGYFTVKVGDATGKTSSIVVVFEK